MNRQINQGDLICYNGVIFLEGVISRRRVIGREQVNGVSVGMLARGEQVAVAQVERMVVTGAANAMLLILLQSEGFDSDLIMI